MLHKGFMLWLGANRTREDVDGISDNQLDTRLCTEGLLLRGGSSGGGYNGKLSSISLWKLQSEIYIYYINQNLSAIESRRNCINYLFIKKIGMGIYFIVKY